MFLDIEDVDLAEQLLRINRGKGNKERIVPISHRACEWLMFYISKVRSVTSFIGSGSALCLANSGKRYSPNKLSEMAGRYVQVIWI
jgi:integrase/recombinase XerD